MHPGDIRKKSTRVCRAPWPHAMAQFICSRIAENRENPIPEMAHAYGLRLPLWLLTKPKFPRPLIKFLSFPFSVDFSYFSFLYSLVGSSYAQKLHGHVTLKIWVPRFILHVHHATLIFPGVIFGIYFMGECHKCTGSSTSCKLHWNVQLNLYYTYTILHWIATSTDHLSLALITCP